MYPTTDVFFINHVTLTNNPDLPRDILSDIVIEGKRVGKSLVLQATLA
jgi:hypothetical protein